MEGYPFFLSYANDDFGPYMGLFFEDLKEAVRSRLGHTKEEPVAFRDKDSIELGRKWTGDLLEALQSSRVLVCLFTPLYFRRDYCGKEVELFLLRQKQLEQTAPRDSFIIPVLWSPCTNVSPSLASLQTYTSELPEQYPVKGLLVFTQNHARFKKEYWDCVHTIADKIADAAQQEPPLPRLDPTPQLDDVSNAFEPEAGSTTPKGPVQDAPLGPSTVQFFYVAGKKSEIKAHKNNHDYYDDRGGAFWRPSLHSPRRVGAVAPAVATSNGLDLVPFNSSFDGSFSEQMEAAKKSNHLVVLIVDTWTVHCLPAYHKIMKGYDDRPCWNCSVLIVWNENDDDTEEHRAVLQECIEDTFRVNASREQTYFRASIQSMTELEVNLREILERLRMKILEYGEREARRALGSSSFGTRPIFALPADRTER